MSACRFTAAGTQVKNRFASLMLARCKDRNIYGKSWRTSLKLKAESVVKGAAVICAAGTIRHRESFDIAKSVLVEDTVPSEETVRHAGELKKKGPANNRQGDFIAKPHTVANKASSGRKPGRSTANVDATKIKASWGEHLSREEWQKEKKKWNQNHKELSRAARSAPNSLRPPHGTVLSLDQRAQILKAHDALKCLVGDAFIKKVDDAAAEVVGNKVTAEHRDAYLNLYVSYGWFSQGQLGLLAKHARNIYPYVRHSGIQWQHFLDWDCLPLRKELMDLGLYTRWKIGGDVRIINNIISGAGLPLEQKNLLWQSLEPVEQLTFRTRLPSDVPHRNRVAKRLDWIYRSLASQPRELQYSFWKNPHFVLGFPSETAITCPAKSSEKPTATTEIPSKRLEAPADFPKSPAATPNNESLKTRPPPVEPRNNAPQLSKSTDKSPVGSRNNGTGPPQLPKPTGNPPVETRNNGTRPTKAPNTTVTVKTTNSTDSTVSSKYNGTSVAELVANNGTLKHLQQSHVSANGIAATEFSFEPTGFTEAPYAPYAPENPCTVQNFFTSPNSHCTKPYVATGAALLIFLLLGYLTKRKVSRRRKTPANKKGSPSLTEPATPAPQTQTAEENSRPLMEPATPASQTQTDEESSRPLMEPATPALQTQAGEESSRPLTATRN